MLFLVLAGWCSFFAWLVLVFARDGFWKMDPALTGDQPLELSEPWPSVTVVVPARNEARVLPRTLPTLLRQVYPGRVQVVLVDDGSLDATASLALAIARDVPSALPLVVLRARPTPAGWAGKVWAMEEGRREAESYDYILFTDADVAHPPWSLAALVAKAERDRCSLVSLMVRLDTHSFWARLTIPAFVFFFAKLYPFSAVNDPRRRTAAAAGGVLLLRTACLSPELGLQPIRGSLIDDCALAAYVKARGGRLFLGLGPEHLSLRPYRRLADVWQMVARSAFEELRHRTSLLLVTVLGMSLLYLVPPTLFFLGLSETPLRPQKGVLLALPGALAWALATLAYRPIVRWYRLSPLWALTLPLAASLYTAMTVDSARRHWLHEEIAWRGRRLTPPAPDTDPTDRSSAPPTAGGRPAAGSAPDGPANAARMPRHRS